MVVRETVLCLFPPTELIEISSSEIYHILQSDPVRFLMETSGRVTVIADGIPKRVMYTCSPGCRKIACTYDRAKGVLCLPPNIVDPAAFNQVAQWLVKCVTIGEPLALPILCQGKDMIQKTMPYCGVFLWLEREDIISPIYTKLAEIFRKRSPMPEEYDLIDQTLPKRHPLKTLILEEHVSRLATNPNKGPTEAFEDHLRSNHSYLEKYLFKLRCEKDPKFLKEVEQRREQSRREKDRRKSTGGGSFWNPGSNY
jgi:hypothetical protein